MRGISRRNKRHRVPREHDAYGVNGRSNNNGAWSSVGADRSCVRPATRKLRTTGLCAHFLEMARCPDRSTVRAASRADTRKVRPYERGGRAPIKTRVAGRADTREVQA